MGKRKLVAYDLHQPRRDYEDLWEALRGFKHCELQGSVWAIETSKSCKVVRDELGQHIDNNDEILVVTMSNWAATMPRSKLDCLKALMD